MIAAIAAPYADSQTVAGFGTDPWWIILIKALVIFVFLAGLTLFMILFERRVVARMQMRIGPNRVGPNGSLQSLADGIKLALKEDIIPALADKPVYVLAPVISAIPAFMAFAVIPMGGEVSIAGHHTMLQLTDLPVGVLYVLAMSAVGVYGIVLAGWSSGSTYPLLGGLRSTAQVISYEIAMSLSLVPVFIYAGSLSTSEIVAAQEQRWNIVFFISFVIYIVAAVGETNRAPFDLPEAEGELVGGFHTEYSSLKFAMFFLAEYINMTTVAALATTIFLGGWLPPWPLSQFDSGWITLLWFLIKLMLVLFFFVWLRGTLPRMRYDQFMKLGWKVLIPTGLVWLLLVAAMRVYVNNESDRRDILTYGGAVLVVLFLVIAFWPAPKETDTGGGGADTAPYDAFAGGYPVPPMPGQIPAGTLEHPTEEVSGGRR